MDGFIHFFGCFLMGGEGVVSSYEKLQTSDVLMSQDNELNCNVENNKVSKRMHPLPSNSLRDLANILLASISSSIAHIFVC